MYFSPTALSKRRRRRCSIGSVRLFSPLQSPVVFLPCPIPPLTDLVYRDFKFIDSPERLHKKSYAPFNIPQVDPFRRDYFSALVMVIAQRNGYPPSHVAL